MPVDPHSIMGDTYLSQRGCLRGCDRHANWDLKRRIDCCETLPVPTLISRRVDMQPEQTLHE